MENFGGVSMSDKPEPPYTVKEAAAKARVNPKTFYEGIHRGDIPAFRVNKVYRIPRVAFDALLRNGKIGSGEEAA
jgi:excisionase family DNA binding protein